LKNSYIKTGI